MSRQALGAWAEEQAVVFLESLGYAVCDRNWRTAGGEIDIVALDQATLVVVEVRARRGSRYGTPEESITPAKAERLRRLCYAYLDDRAAADRPWNGPYRIDIVAIQLDSSGFVQHLNHVISAIGE